MVLKLSDKFQLNNLVTNGSVITSLTETITGVIGTSGTLTVDPSSGSIHRYVLTGNSTISFSTNWTNGQSVLLLISSATFTLTWPTITWINNKATAPTLSTSRYNTVVIWKMDNAYYGVFVGNGS